MEVLTVNPHGYCQGVFRALKIAMQAKRDHPDSPIFLLGMIVHNEVAARGLEAEGFFLLDEQKAPLIEHLRQRKKGDVIVFSAHGHPRIYDEICQELGLIAIDATCPFVFENEASGENAARPLFYLGMKGHLEAEAFLANLPEAIFLDVSSPSTSLKGEKCSLIAQTTLSSDELETGMRCLQERFAHVELLRSRCDATKIRQEAIASLPSDVDLLIVLGSARSNNSRKLAEIGRSRGIETHLILDESELPSLPLQGKKKVALASGASTPLEVFAKVKEALRSL